MMVRLFSPPLWESGGGEGRRCREVRRRHTCQAPALSPGPSPASGRREQTGGMAMP
ncbi:hypothetical protein CO2235_MP10437 [Cupriavidus oxalaticus]|uniref:Uncharacterized protein n=1 Tax=Cupriavidus oxalaticus TaxID=96344 RepID=A0A375GFZ8_9BURK|nr:hypothetical protein CO2235_MP10437 [Cupriavidus oxalaticus]